MKRILITGSRKWRDGDIIRDALRAAYRVSPGPLEVVEGEAAGADLLAKQAAYWLNDNEGYAFNVKKMPADWEAHCPRCPEHRKQRRHGGDYGPAAGFIRNQKMVDLGNYLICLAFPVGTGWSGTRDCMSRAEKAGIEVMNFGG